MYLEDFTVGSTFELGAHTVTREEIIRFATEFDPQPFHIDDEAANRSSFRGLVASGWHTASLAMRLLVDGLAGKIHSLGSPGVDQMRWLVPLRPGDTVRLVVEVADIKLSSSKPDRGTIWLEEKLFNQKNELVMTKRSLGIIKRKP